MARHYTAPFRCCLHVPTIATLLVLLNVLFYEPIEYDEFWIHIWNAHDDVCLCIWFKDKQESNEYNITGTSFIFYWKTIIFKKKDQKNTESQQIIVSWKLLVMQYANKTKIFIVMYIIGFTVATITIKSIHVLEKDTTCLHVEKV